MQEPRARSSAAPQAESQLTNGHLRRLHSLETKMNTLKIQTERKQKLFDHQIRRLDTDLKEKAKEVGKLKQSMVKLGVLEDEVINLRVKHLILKQEHEHAESELKDQQKELEVMAKAQLVTNDKVKELQKENKELKDKIAAVEKSYDKMRRDMWKEWEKVQEQRRLY